MIVVAEMLSQGWLALPYRWGVLALLQSVVLSRGREPGDDSLALPGERGVLVLFQL